MLIHPDLIMNISDEVFLYMMAYISNPTDFLSLLLTCKRFKYLVKDCIITYLKIDHINKFPQMIHRVKSLKYINYTLPIDTAKLIVKFINNDKINNLHIEVDTISLSTLNVISCKALKTLISWKITTEYFYKREEFELSYRMRLAHLMNTATELIVVNLPKYASKTPINRIGSNLFIRKK